MSVAHPVDQRLERIYRVRFDEAGPDGMLRSSGYLRFAQDLAWIHSESAGFGRVWYGERGLFWLVRGVELDVLEPIEYGSEIVVTTQVIGFRRVIARRKSEFRRPGTERPIAEALTDWVLLNDAGRPVRPPDEILKAFVGQPNAFSPIRVPEAERPQRPASAVVRTFGVRRSEADPMAHVNNAGYIDYLDEQYLAVIDAPIPTELPAPRRYRAEFVGEARPGSRLAGQSWQGTTEWCYRLEGDGDTELFRATVETDPARWIGG